MDDLRAALAIEVDRIADRLRGLSQARLAEPVPGHASRADAARSTAQALADAAARIEFERAPDRHAAPGPGNTASQLRALPTLTEFAAGDQVAVTGHDLIAALDGLPAGSRAERDAVMELTAHALEQLQTLRRLL